MRLRIDVSSLQRSGEALGIGGSANAYSLRDVVLTFRRVDGKLHYEHLNGIRVLEPSLYRIPSLLGLDVLHRFTISYKGRYCYLDR